jgi:hypothetical protein
VLGEGLLRERLTPAVGLRMGSDAEESVQNQHGCQARHTMSEKERLVHDYGKCKIADWPALCPSFPSSVRFFSAASGALASMSCLIV